MTGIKNDVPQTPDDFGFINYPNPFNSSTAFEFELAQPAQTDLSIYNQTGQLIYTLMDEAMAAGKHSIRWNGQSRSALVVASGLYFAVLNVDGAKSTTRVLMLR
jgi:flagellar hook assembly protein FlgD